MGSLTIKMPLGRSKSPVLLPAPTKTHFGLVLAADMDLDLAPLRSRSRISAELSASEQCGAGSHARSAGGLGARSDQPSPGTSFINSLGMRAGWIGATAGVRARWMAPQAQGMSRSRQPCRLWHPIKPSSGRTLPL